LKILVIRFFHIGDVLLTIPLCSTLKRSIPNCMVDYLVQDTCVPLLEDHPDIDHVIGLSQAERHNPLRYFNKARAITKKSYDLVIDTTSTQKSELFSLLSLGARYRIGRYKKRRGFSYTHRLHEPVPKKDKISQRLSMLQPLVEDGLPIEFVDKMSLYVTDAERQAKRSEMQSYGVNFQRPVFAFAVSSKLKEKQWPEHYMAQLAMYCINHYNAQVILFAGLAHEQVQVDKVFASTHEHKDVYAKIPVFGLRDLAALFANCDIFIGNEGGPRHMADAIGIPTVSVVSPHAKKHEWLPPESDRHRAVEWRDLAQFSDHTIDYQIGDDTYFQLFNSIKPEHVVPLVDNVVQTQLKLDKNPLV